MRIVSLLASATEIVCSLGRKDDLVGRSHECDYPPSITHLPVCTECRIDASASSAAIDSQVKNRLQNTLSLYEVKIDELARLRPDLILTQDLCRVCAVSLHDVEQATCQMLGFQTQMLALSPLTLDDVWEDIRRVAQRIGADDQGRVVIQEISNRVRQVSARTNGGGPRPTVACLEWLDPLMAAGNWMPELVGLAGGINLFGQAGKHSPWMSWQDLCHTDPDIIVCMPCGFDANRARREMPALTSRPGWRALKAVRNGRVYVADGNAFFNRSGPRLVEALEMLAEAIRPEAFDFGHHGVETFESCPGA